MTRTQGSACGGVERCTLRVSLAVALLFASCVRHAPPSPPLERVEAVQPIAIDVGLRSTIESSWSKRPAWLARANEDDVLSYAPRWENRYPHPELSEATASTGALDRELLICTTTEAIAGSRVEVKRGRDSAPLTRFRVAGILGDGPLALPLWSMEPGEAISFTFFHSESSPAPPTVATGTYDGSFPIVARGTSISVSCQLVRHEEIERVTRAYLDEVTTHLDVLVPSGATFHGLDPFRDSPVFANAVTYLRAAAGLLGWAHPVIAGLSERIGSALTVWDAARAALFRGPGVPAAVGVTVPVELDGRRWSVVAIRCTAKSAVTLPTRDIYTPAKRACGVELVNELAGPPGIGDIGFFLASPSRVERFERERMPGSTRGLTLVAHVDPALLEEPTLIVAATNTDAEVVVARVR